MDDDRQLLREAAVFLEQMQASDRGRARRRLQQAPDDPDALSHYERGLLGAEWWAHVRQREAVRKAAARAAAQRATVTAVLCPAGIIFRNDLLRRLNDHAIALCVDYGLTVRRSRDGGGWGSQETKTVCVPAVTSEEHYAVCLHEIGHCVSPDADSRQYASWVEAGHLYAAGGELGAWAWALDHALVWTNDMQQSLESSTESHPAFRRATPGTRLAIEALRARGRAKLERSE